HPARLTMLPTTPCLRAVLMLLCLCSVALAEDPPAEPTAEQLRQLKDTFAKAGAEYFTVRDPRTRQTQHWFRMPATNDAALKKLPPSPFAIGLDLDHSNVSDAGLRDLTGLDNLVLLGLASTQVTDAGLKELKHFPNLISLDLSDTQVTDVGLKE